MSRFNTGTVRFVFFTTWIFCLLPSYSQSDPFVISESVSLELCERTIVFDGIWMSDGIIKADISILVQPNSKPITGGYRKGDEITISSQEGCTYYVFSVTKTGLTDAPGKVILSKFPPVSPLQLCDDTLVWYEGSSYMIDSLDWNITTIRKSSEGELKAFIRESYRTALIKEFILKINDMVWLGECLYKISTLNGEMAVHMGNKWELERGRVVLTKVNDHSDLKGPHIKGEDINKPNIEK